MNSIEQNIEVKNDTISIEADTIIKNLDSIEHPIEHIKSELTNFDSDQIMGVPVSLIGVFIAVFIPLLIFAIGVFISWCKKKKEKKERVKSKISTITNWIQLMKKSIDLQLESNRNFSKEMRNSTIIHPAPISFYNLLADKLQEISLSEYSEYLVENIKGDSTEKNKDLFNIISQIEFLKKIEIRIQVTYNEQKIEIMKMMDEWNKKLKEVDNLVLDDSKDKETVSSIYKMYAELVKLLRKKHPDDYKHLTFITNELIMPLQNFTKELKDNKYANNLTMILTHMLFIEKQFVMNKEGFASVFDEVSVQIKTAYDLLTTASKRIEIREIKSVWKI